MNRFSAIFYLLILPCFAFAAIDGPKKLQVDHHHEPLGIDNETPSFSWVVGDQSRGALQSAYRVMVSSSPKILQQNSGDVWDSKKIPSDQSYEIKYDGKPLQSKTRYYWKVMTWNGQDQPSLWSETSWFETGIFNKNEWEAQWIEDNTPLPERDEDYYDRMPAPLFRKSFNLNKAIKQARLYISGLGYYEAYLNGEKVGDHLLDPGWTQYAQTVFYSAYDVTQHLKNGENAMGVMLGNGWYTPFPLRVFGRIDLREVLTSGEPKFISHLEVKYADGSKEIIGSTPDWKTAPGPIIRNNVYLGEWYDARDEKPGWKSPGYNDRQWKKTQKAEAPAGDLIWQYIPPIKHTRTVYPIAIEEPKPDTFVVDMGQNFAGVIRFRTQAPKGTEIVFRYTELVYPDGTIDTRTTAATQIKKGGIQGGPGAPETAWQEDRYICKGEGIEVFQPSFTFHGFRYVEITGLAEAPGLNDIEGIRLNSDLPDAASFSCSNNLFNTVQEVAEWTMLSNVFSIESDCPAREKFGYGGDMVTAGETYIYNYDMANFYAKTVRDFTNDQLPSGAMTECAPNIGINARGIKPGTGPVGWTLAHPFLLDKLYKYYGNLELVKEQYQPMKELVDFYHENVPEHIIEVGISDHVSLDDRPVPVTSTAFYYHHAQILADMAEVLGKKDDQQKYQALANDIKQAFIDEFVNQQTGEVYTHTQAAQVFALYYDLFPNRQVREKALDALMDEIYIEHDGHLSTGIFATKMMLNVLSDEGLNEVAYDMMSQKEFPGFGYMIDNDATTLWENWGFKKNDSKNHPMFGSVSEWFHRSILGIDQTKESIAFDEIVIKPALVGGLQWAKGHYQSVRGEIAVDWWKFGDDIFMDVSIPANSKAQVYLPVVAKTRPTIIERDEVLVAQGAHQKDLESIRFVADEKEYYHFEVGAGNYQFKIRH